MSLTISKFTGLLQWNVIFNFFPLWLGYWQDLKGLQYFPKMWRCTGQTTSSATTSSGRSKRPALAKIYLSSCETNGNRNITCTLHQLNKLWWFSWFSALSFSLSIDRTWALAIFQFNKIETCRLWAICYHVTQHNAPVKSRPLYKISSAGSDNQGYSNK